MVQNQQLVKTPSARDEDRSGTNRSIVAFRSAKVAMLSQSERRH